MHCSPSQDSQHTCHFSGCVKVKSVTVAIGIQHTDVRNYWSCTIPEHHHTLFLYGRSWCVVYDQPREQHCCFTQQNRLSCVTWVHVSCVQVHGVCCSPSQSPTSSQRHGQARWWTGTAGSVCWPLWAALLSGSRPPTRACTSSLLPSSSPLCRPAGLPSPSLRGASTLMNSRYADALAAPAVADACFAMGIASSETRICLDDSHGSTASFLFADSQQDSAVADFERQLLYSTALSIECSAAELELGAHVCVFSRESNQGHP